MKVKEEKCFPCGDYYDVEISTADLIAELEKRRPSGCPNKCEYLGSEFCGACIWVAFIGEEKGAITDNFKEAK